MATAPLRLIPLGGLGEVGKNMMALEYGNDIVVIDCGVLFPEEEMLGVDLMIPDISYLIERQKKVRAILITHGHEDHVGGLPYLLARVQAPLYTTALTRGLIEVKLKEHHLLDQVELHTVASDSVLHLERQREQVAHQQAGLPRPAPIPGKSAVKCN